MVNVFWVPWSNMGDEWFVSRVTRVRVELGVQDKDLENLSVWEEKAWDMWLV